MSGNSPFTARREGDGLDIITVHFHFSRSISSGIVGLTTSEEFLSVGLVVKDDTNGSGVVGSLVVVVEVGVLATVVSSVPVNVLDSVACVGFVHVDIIVNCGLSNLTNPRLNSHKFLAFNFFFCFEEVTTVVGTVDLFSSSDTCLIEFVTSFSGVSCT